MADHIFISYANDNKAIAQLVCDYLENAQIQSWMAPRDITPGATYLKAIIAAINNSSLMVLILSKESNDSPHVIRELERAFSKKIPIVPFKIEHLELSEEMEYLISSTQWLEGFPSPIEDHFTELIEAINKILGKTGDQIRSVTPPKSPKRSKRLRKKEVSASKGQEYCVLCKGKLSGTFYICPNCKTVYCKTCVQADGTDGRCLMCNEKFQFL